jgi:hypothetical protein
MDRIYRRISLKATRHSRKWFAGGRKGVIMGRIQIYFVYSMDVEEGLCARVACQAAQSVVLSERITQTHG